MIIERKFSCLQKDNDQALEALSKFIMKRLLSEHKGSKKYNQKRELKSLNR